jgi:hypothetical protein
MNRRAARADNHVVSGDSPVTLGDSHEVYGSVCECFI